ncbi:YfhO family protein [Myroides pelagicus]|uniref:YfhO family protein n=1 Tax=Myroides pelagicus TaxID=270914 RepID=A0A7K1GIT7_9FLAO|nr:YfhO family protein [Myroides pelagicus]MEC4114598.1 YfhO family protein [Myroides pelagicus]MTH28373.1 YfhO family protein [Myroides pelagicus]
MDILKKILPHLLVILGFITISLLYFSPVLSGKTIYQSDIVQYTGMAKEQIEFRKQTGEEPYWTNSAFGGMPTYQLGAKYPNNFIKDIDSIFRTLPRPADYLFLYFFGFYTLLISLGLRPLRSFIGALAFGFSTYLIIILGVGHNAKAHAIAYMPMVLAGVMLVFRKKWIVGGILTVFAAALEISANHFQMTYYLLLLLLVVTAYYTVYYIKNKDYKSLATAFGIFVIAAILSIGANATNLLATSEYTKFSTRGKNELTFNPDGSKANSSNALSYDYITEYSYGKFESLNLLVPRLTGGANNEKLGEDSSLFKFAQTIGASPLEAKQFADQAPTYWGDQPIVAAPAYIGAVVFFLFVLAFFTEKRKFKYIFIAGALLSLLLSWGKNFSLLTDFFIDYVPLYDKFRAVSSIQVILELCVPALAILGLYSFSKGSKQEQLNALKYSLGIVLGLLIALFFIKGTLNFSGLNDSYYRQAYGDYGMSFVKALIEDRKAMYSADLIRSFVFVLLAGGVLYGVYKEKIATQYSLIILGLLMTTDLVLVDKKYVNDTNFVPKIQMEKPFSPTQADKAILSDPEHFRVFEMQGGFNSARASFFHNSLGGYHAAKPRRMQQLMDYQINQNNMEVLNMLNVKYIIQKDEQGNDIPLVNPEVNGNAWFVSSLATVPNADEEMKALSTLKSKEQAIINNTDNPLATALRANYTTDSLSSITLVNYAPNKLVYTSKNSNDGFAVFSEIYYPKGWKARINDKEVEIFNVDYVLRGIEIPKGEHTISFTFEPEVIKKGSIISLISFIIIILLTIIAIGYTCKKDCNKK